MNKIAVILILSLLPQVLFSQDTIYFDKFWHETEPEKAMYFRTIEETDDHFYVRDHYLENNQVQMEGYFSALEPEEEMDGHFVWYNKEGVKKREGEYKEGKENGKWIWFYPDGQIHREATYENGKKEGTAKEYYESGKLYQEVTYKNGILHGETTFWYENGKKNVHGQYEYGSKKGTWTYWTITGDLEGTEEY